MFWWILLGLALWGVIASVRAVLTDGRRRVPDAPVVRQEERA